jgi:hypothetical protein
MRSEHAQFRSHRPGREATQFGQMGEVERLIDAFRAEGDGARVAWKLDVLLDLVRENDPRVVPFLLSVLADPRESNAVRLDVLQRLRNGRLKPLERPRVADTIVKLLSERSNTGLCLQSALALGEFTDLPGVVAVLGGLALQCAAPLDLRYAAFTSLQRGGPARDAIEIMSTLTEDEVLGRAASSVLRSWRFRDL